MVTKFEKTQEQLLFRINGENELEVGDFADILTSLSDFMRYITAKEEPESLFRLTLKEVRPCCIQILLESFYSVVPALVSHLADAKTLVEMVLIYIQIKTHLQGMRPKKVQIIDEASEVENNKGELLKVPTRAAHNFFSDAKIENCMIKIISPIIGEQDFKSVDFGTPNGLTVSIEQKEFNDFQKPIVEQMLAERMRPPLINTMEIALLLRKPDLLGDSKWGFVFDKNIEATIHDKTWLDKVRSGQIRNLYAGVKIPVKLQVTTKIVDNKAAGTDYDVLQITGDIIEPDDDQLEFCV